MQAVALPYVWPPPSAVCVAYTDLPIFCQPCDAGPPPVLRGRLVPCSGSSPLCVQCEPSINVEGTDELTFPFCWYLMQLNK